MTELAEYAVPHGADVIVIGAGMVGAACAYELAKAGLSVCVVDRGAIVGGTTGAGEGNILVSDKEPGPELELALLSRQLWSDLRQEMPDDIELEAKGGVVVATSSDAWQPLQEYAARQRAAGVLAHEVRGSELLALEPHLAPDLTNAVHYPQDMQVQPMLAAAHMLRAARTLGAKVLTYTNVTGVRRDHGGAVTGVRTDRGDVPCTWVVNAAGTWGAHVAELMGQIARDVDRAREAVARVTS